MSTGNGRTEDAGANRATTRSRRLTGTIAAAALVIGAVGGLWAWSAMGSDVVSTSGDTELGHAEEERQLGNDSSGAIEGGTGNGVEVASMTATLTGGRFELGGRLPDPTVATRIREVATIVYGRSAFDTLTIDPSLADPSWAQVAGDVVASLPLISNGGVELKGDIATLRGVAGSDQKRSRFNAAVGQILGPGIELVDKIEVVKQEQPILLMKKRAPNVIELEGLLPSPQQAKQIQDVLAETYTGHAFDTTFTFDGGVEETFTLHSLPRLAGMFAKFPTWEISYVDGRFESSSAGAASFDTDSAALAMGTPILDSFAMSMTGVPNLRLTVVGHTDSTGQAAYNQDLSERRAATVVEYLMVQHGIDASRLTVIGRGEEQPIASNDTNEGRLQNRRVDFLIEIPDG